MKVLGKETRGMLPFVALVARAGDTVWLLHPSSSRRMPEATNTTQPSSLQGLREAGAQDHHPARLSPTLCSRQPCPGPGCLVSIWLPTTLPHRAFCPGPLRAQLFVLFTQHLLRRKMNPYPPTPPLLLHTTGEDWSYMEKLVMKAVLGSSTSKVTSLDSLARLTILLVMTVWANRDVTLQSTWRL